VVATGLGLIAATVLFLVWSSSPPVGTAEEPTTTAIAILTRAVGVKWAEPAGGVRVGASLAPGWLRLEAGLAEVELFSGARVILEGPVELRLVSTAEAFCRAGKLSAEVSPQAQGFRIGTPQRDLVDRGTAFGLAVTRDGAEVHVFQGKLELHRPGAEHQDLSTGEAVAVTAGAPDRKLPARPAGFVTRADLDRRQEEALQRRRDRWQTAGREWSADPALLARFDFEGSDRWSLRNVATNGSAVGDGAVVGGAWAEGRWPGKRALELSGVGDRVRLSIPGEHRSLTLLAWVRVHGLDRKFNSLLMADAFDPGAVHWQVLSDGKVRLGISGPGNPRLANYDSPRVFTPDRLGQWVHLAVVYDADLRQVTHFMDGRRVSREALKFDIPLRFGRAELGNWNPATRADAVPIRHFSGRIDELALFARPQSDEEVRRHAEAD
jgi:hypothetical protein